MSDDLRTRIATALRTMTGDLTYEAMADAVIRELRLNERQWTWSWDTGNGGRAYGYPVDTHNQAVEESGQSYQIVHRYVTEWTTDD